MSNTSEKQLTNKIIKHFNQLYSDRGFIYKRYAIGNEAGKPDLTGVLDSKRVEVEVKAPSRSNATIKALERSNQTQDMFKALNLLASKRQQYWLRRFAKFGAITGVVTSLDQLDSLIKSST
jgi:hypothetical protein